MMKRTWMVLPIGSLLIAGAVAPAAAQRVRVDVTMRAPLVSFEQDLYPQGSRFVDEEALDDWYNAERRYAKQLRKDERKRYEQWLKAEREYWKKRWKAERERVKRLREAEREYAKDVREAERERLEDRREAERDYEKWRSDMARERGYRRP